MFCQRMNDIDDIIFEDRILEGEFTSDEPDRKLTLSVNISARETGLDTDSPSESKFIDTLPQSTISNHLQL